MSNQTAYRYWAFISYTSADRSWARWLHRAIETYGIPAQLARHPTPAGEAAPKRFRPIFRDRTELPASSDLGVQIEAALRASRYLIIICSPHAARSKWVNKEIEIFQSLGRSAHVFAFIVDGEPNTGDERECFPPALRQAEPVAADARPHGDGKGNAKLKLLAGMLGVGFDTLKRRETYQRIRRLQVGIVISIIMALGFASMLFYVEGQRTEAEKSRVRADRLADYLISDLQAKLEPLGRQDILRDVQERVDAYYRELRIQGALPDNPSPVAALRNEGRRLQAEGDLNGALRKYRVARVSIEHMSPSDISDNSERQGLLAAVHVDVGGVLEDQGHLKGALREYRAALSIAKRQSSSNRSSVDYRRDMSNIYDDVARVLEAQGDLNGALREYRSSLSIAKRIASFSKDNIDYRRDLSRIRESEHRVLNRLRGVSE